LVTRALGCVEAGYNADKKGAVGFVRSWPKAADLGDAAKSSAYLGYSRRAANVVRTAGLDPKANIVRIAAFWCLATWSARARKVSGIVTLIAFAVLR
jgi:hypothetical protein